MNNNISISRATQNDMLFIAGHIQDTWAKHSNGNMSKCVRCTHCSSMEHSDVGEVITNTELTNKIVHNPKCLVLAAKRVHDGVVGEIVQGCY